MDKCVEEEFSRILHFRERTVAVSAHAFAGIVASELTA